MNAEWQQKLISFGLEQTDSGLSYPASPGATDVFCTLDAEVILEVTGEGAEPFLQAQFSNDVADMDIPGSQLNTWSSPKGRVITLFRLTRIADGYLIRMPRVLSEPVLKRLKMYASMFRVEIDQRAVMVEVNVDQRDDLITVGLSGDSVEPSMQNAGIVLPQEVDATVALPKTFSADGWITKVRGTVARYEMTANANTLATLWGHCEEHFQLAAESEWRLQNIDAGLPSVTEATTEAFVLQMMNLNFINGVSFKKGCFPGQEVVARMQYLGKLKRQMFRLSYDGENLPVAGDEIFKAGSASAAGKVVDAVSTGDNTSRMLAVIAIDATTEPLYLDKEASMPVKLLELPYELTATD